MKTTAQRAWFLTVRFETRTRAQSWNTIVRGGESRRPGPERTAGPRPGQPRAVDGPPAADRDIRHPDEVEQARGPITLHALPAGVDRGEVRQVRRALEHRAGAHLQVDARLEIKGPAQEDARGHRDHAAARGGAGVDCPLDRRGRDGGAV